MSFPECRPIVHQQLGARLRTAQERDSSQRVAEADRFSQQPELRETLSKMPWEQDCWDSAMTICRRTDSSKSQEATGDSSEMRQQRAARANKQPRHTSSSKYQTYNRRTRASIHDHEVHEYGFCTWVINLILPQHCCAQPKCIPSCVMYVTTQ